MRRTVTLIAFALLGAALAAALVVSRGLAAKAQPPPEEQVWLPEIPAELPEPPWPGYLHGWPEVREHRWKDAIVRLARTPREDPFSLQKVDEWTARARLAELYVYDLQPEVAKERFEVVLQAQPRPGRRQGATATRAAILASDGLARVHAEMGRYAEAVARPWWEPELGGPMPGCGTCMAGEVLRDDATEAVWRAAGLPEPEAQRELRRFVEGTEPPRRYLMHTEMAREQWQRNTAAEAALILGRRHEERGEAEAARVFYRRAVATNLTDHPAVLLAATRLERLP